MIYESLFFVNSASVARVWIKFIGYLSASFPATPKLLRELVCNQFSIFRKHGKLFISSKQKETDCKSVPARDQRQTHRSASTMTVI